MEIKQNYTISFVEFLEIRLNDLIPRWRGAKKGSVEESELEKEYIKTLIAMLEWGYNDHLDMDALLPEELMPKQYYDRNIK